MIDIIRAVNKGLLAVTPDKYSKKIYFLAVQFQYICLL